MQVLTHYLLPVVALAVGTNIPRFLEMIQSRKMVEEGRGGIESEGVFKVPMFHLKHISKAVNLFFPLV